MSEENPKPVGRPSIYSDEIAAEICVRLSQGESLKVICDDAHLPVRSTIYLWLYENKEFSDRYRRARECQAEHWAEEVLEISDDGSNDWMERFGKEGEKLGWMLNGEHVQRSKLRVDTRKWLMARLAPKKYGDKVTQEHVGAGGGPVVIERRIIDPVKPV